MTDQVLKMLCDRWGVEHLPWGGRQRMGHMLAISLGLGSIYNESVDAERAWMHRMHPRLGTTPIEAVLADRAEAVHEIVLRERSLR